MFCARRNTARCKGACSALRALEIVYQKTNVERFKSKIINSVSVPFGLETVVTTRPMVRKLSGIHNGFLPYTQHKLAAHTHLGANSRKTHANTQHNTNYTNIVECKTRRIVVQATTTPKTKTTKPKRNDVEWVEHERTERVLPAYWLLMGMGGWRLRDGVWWPVTNNQVSSEPAVVRRPRCCYRRGLHTAHSARQSTNRHSGGSAGIHRTRVIFLGYLCARIICSWCFHTRTRTRRRRTLWTGV